MPSAQRVSWAQLRVGLMAVAAMAILAVLIFLLTGSGDLFSTSVRVITYLSDSSAMAENSQVRLNGILVGNIDRIAFTGSKEPGKVVEIDMSIKREFLAQIPDDSTAGISASNMLGDKFINITKGKSPNHVKDGGVIIGADTKDIPELFNRAGDLMGTLQVTLSRVDKMLADIDAGKGSLGKILREEELYNEVVDTVSEVKALVEKVNNGQGSLSRLLNEDTLYQEVRGPIRRIDDVLAGIQRGEGTAGKFLKDEALYQELRKTIAEVRKVAEDLNKGKGTAGKLLKDEALYKQLNTLVARLDATVEKVNSGQGTLGQLLVNPQLYESLNGTTRELHALMKDIRANPKKFLRIKLGIF